ncbi:hypothetical protein NE237_022806 [Protea cynaroides]|uniref:Transposase (putative) gypsy type domain-containing protein n=1 Tax=Protea cynaroides TaxID=273540 RepID=A0A9Q0K4U0_9MAGN|nr:hypothetical protein NE237_022806 [Protea cynaroides]
MGRKRAAVTRFGQSTRECDLQETLTHGPLCAASFIESKMTLAMIASLKNRCFIPPSIQLDVPNKDDRASHPFLNRIVVYEEMFSSGFRFPGHYFVYEILNYYGLAPAQLLPNGWACIIAFIIYFTKLKTFPNLAMFRELFYLAPMKWRHPTTKLHVQDGTYYFMRRASIRSKVIIGTPPSNQCWKFNFFFASIKSESLETKTEFPIGNEWKFVDTFQVNLLPELTLEEKKILEGMEKVKPVKYKNLKDDAYLYRYGLVEGTNDETWEEFIGVDAFQIARSELISKCAASIVEDLEDPSTTTPKETPPPEIPALQPCEGNKRKKDSPIVLSYDVDVTEEGEELVTSHSTKRAKKSAPAETQKQVSDVQEKSHEALEEPPEPLGSTPQVQGDTSLPTSSQRIEGLEQEKRAEESLSEQRAPLFIPGWNLTTADGCITDGPAAQSFVNYGCLPKDMAFISSLNMEELRYASYSNVITHMNLTGRYWLEYDRAVSFGEAARKAQVEPTQAQRDAEIVLTAEKKRVSDLQEIMNVREREAADLKAHADKAFEAAENAKRLYTELEKAKTRAEALAKEAFDEVQRLRSSNEALVIANLTAKTEREFFKSERDSLRVASDALKTEKETLIAERDALTKKESSLQFELAPLQEERKQTKEARIKDTEAILANFMESENFQKCIRFESAKTVRKAAEQFYNFASTLLPAHDLSGCSLLAKVLPDKFQKQPSATSTVDPGNLPYPPPTAVL